MSIDERPSPTPRPRTGTGLNSRPRTRPGPTPVARGVPVAPSLARTGPITCELSVVVPTRNESLNIGLLARRIRDALEGESLVWEVIFVDDSDDSTPDVVRTLAANGAPVRLLHRPRGSRWGGLGGAVQEGFLAARGTVVAVMDADLQHPPEVLPALVAPVLSGEADLVAGSRYGWAGGDAGLSGPVRHVASRLCRLLVHALVPSSRALQDPLSGLFVVKRSLLGSATLRPQGYKILLEVAVRARPRAVFNVGFDFAPRNAGSSKASLAEGMVFLRQLSRLVFASRFAQRDWARARAPRGAAHSAALLAADGGPD